MFVKAAAGDNSEFAAWRRRRTDEKTVAVGMKRHGERGLAAEAH